MEYKFICPNCQNRQEIEMAMSEYTSKNHKCDKCGTELQRDIKDFCSAFDTSHITGFCGKCGK